MQKPAKYVFQLLYQLSNKEKEGQEVLSTLRPLCRNNNYILIENIKANWAIKLQYSRSR